MLLKIYISDKCCSSELYIHQRNLTQEVLAFQILIIITIMFLEQHIIMISEDHVTLKTDADNTALITEINNSLTY